MPITITIIAVQGQICSPFSNSVNRCLFLIKNERSVRTAVTVKAFQLSSVQCPGHIWQCVSEYLCVLVATCLCVGVATNANVLLDSTFVCSLDLCFLFFAPFSISSFWDLFLLSSLFFFGLKPRNRFELNVPRALASPGRPPADVVVILIVGICYCFWRLFIYLFWHFTEHGAKRWPFWHDWFYTIPNAISNWTISVYIQIECMWHCVCPSSEWLLGICWVNGYGQGYGPREELTNLSHFSPGGRLSPERLRGTPN